VSEESFLNVSSGLRERSRKVLDKMLSVLLGKDFVPEHTRLFVGSVGMWNLESASLSLQVLFVPCECGIFLRATHGIRFVVHSTSTVAVNY